MKHHTLTILALLAAVAILGALASTLAVSIVVPQNARGAIVVALTSPRAPGSHRTPLLHLDATCRVSFRVNDLPAGIYAVMVFVQQD